METTLTDIFAPSLYNSVRLPCEQAETLPSWCYTSDAFFNREVERIFKPLWHFVGREEEIKKPGDYITKTLFEKKFFVIRGKDKKIRAFFNSCRHRGSRLLTNTGRCKVIRCPYHSWTYNFDGTLHRSPGMEKVTEFNKEDYGLDELHLETFQGMIFVNLTKDPEPFDDYIGNFKELVGYPYHLEDMVCVRKKQYTLNSNWKLYAEVDMETLHTPNIHKNSIGDQPVEWVESVGQWISVYNKSDQTVALEPKERDKGFPHIRGLTGKSAEGVYFSILFPGFFLVTAQDCMWWIHKIPEGPEKTRVDVGFCFPKETVERDDFEEIAQKYYRRWNQVNEEDNWITEFQQESMRSSRPGRYSHHEIVVHAFDNWVLDRVLGK